MGLVGARSAVKLVYSEIALRQCGGGKHRFQIKSAKPSSRWRITRRTNLMGGCMHSPHASKTYFSLRIIFYRDSNWYQTACPNCGRRQHNDTQRASPADSFSHKRQPLLPHYGRAVNYHRPLRGRLLIFSHCPIGLLSLQLLPRVCEIESARERQKKKKQRAAIVYRAMHLAKRSKRTSTSIRTMH